MATPPAAASNAQADKLVADAEYKMKPGVFGSIFSGGNQRFSDAADMFAKAGNLYKMSKQPDRAGDAFLRSADAHSKGGNKADCGQALLNAANCYRKAAPTRAAEILQQAISMYVSEGRFSIAAKHQKDIAEIYENEMDFDNAIEAYQSAADMYEGENAQSSANQCLLKVALFSAQQEKYPAAIEIYEKTAQSAMGNNLLKWSVKDYLFRGALCHLASGDMVSAKRALERYQDIDPSFGSTREFKFLTSIVEAVEAFDLEQFTAASVEFDSISKLDSWKTTILLRIKNGIKDGAEPDLT